jgi:hypothetical protein
MAMHMHFQQLKTVVRMGGKQFDFIRKGSFFFVLFFFVLFFFVLFLVVFHLFVFSIFMISRLMGSSLFLRFFLMVSL